MDRCACCGFPIRDGLRLCPVCAGTSPQPDAILKDGTPVYLKTCCEPNVEQLKLYTQLFKKEN